MSGQVTVTRSTLDDVSVLRDQYRHEMQAQIVHDSWHPRGFTDFFVCRFEERMIGHGAVGGAPGDPRHTVKEFFLLPEWRGRALEAFDALIAESDARAIEVQTNDHLLSSLFFDRARDWLVTHVLFSDAYATQLPPPLGVTLRPVTADDHRSIFVHEHEPVGEWGLARDGVFVATGGVMSHYNPPFGDIYMEVASIARGRGCGSYLVQELKRICRQQGKAPAARCRPDNLASRRTLVRAGMWPCAHILRGVLGS